MKIQFPTHFWDKFIQKTKTYHVKESAIQWYVRHVENYIKLNSTIDINSHTAQQLDKYLKVKGRQQKLLDWQFKQIVCSLKIAFKDVLTLPWAQSFPWDEWEAQAQDLPNSHATLARDYSPVLPTSEELDNSSKKAFKNIYSAYPEHIENLIKQIRLKNYSVRTEQTYLNWFLRFAAFHLPNNPNTLDDKAIAQYLEYLVFKRKVSAGTQSQALNAIIFFYKQVL